MEEQQIKMTGKTHIWKRKWKTFGRLLKEASFHHRINTWVNHSYLVAKKYRNHSGATIKAVATIDNDVMFSALMGIF